jgi:hypothetical protein
MKKLRLVWLGFVLILFGFWGCTEEPEQGPVNASYILPEALPDSFLFKLSWGPIDQPGFIFDIRPDSGMYLSLSDTASEYHVFKPDLKGFEAYFQRIRAHQLFRQDPSNNSPGVLVGHVMIILPDTGYIFPLADSTGVPFVESGALIADAETEAFRQIGLSSQEILLKFQNGKKNETYKEVRLSVTQGNSADIFRAFQSIPKQWQEPVWLVRDSALVHVEAMDQKGDLWEWDIKTMVTDTVKGLRVIMENDEIELYIE